MAQRKQLTWTELRVGLFVLVALLVIAVGIFYVTGSSFWGPKYQLKTFFPEVAGVSDGAPVRLDGVDIGNVLTVRMTTQTANRPVEKSRNIEVTMRLDKRFQAMILTDSTATLVTEGLLGNRYVNISRGLTGVPLKDGQEVPGTAEKSLADVMASMQGLTADFQVMVTDLQNGKGTLGKLLTDDAAYNNLNSLLAKSSNMVGNIQQGRGTLGKLVTSDELYGKANQTLDNVNGVMEDVRAGKGSLGKLYTDDTLYNKLKDTSTNLANATAKFNDNTTTAGKLFSDPKLYDNLTGLTGDMRLLIGDFRQNPKKFLRIKVAIF
jgi:phospholipid/cholesterol/gamma-HCH transport system substrate-binding protein